MLPSAHHGQSRSSLSWCPETSLSLWSCPLGLTQFGHVPGHSQHPSRPCATGSAPASGNDFSGRFTVTFTLGTENSASFTNVISIEGSFPISFHLSPN